MHFMSPHEESQNVLYLYKDVFLRHRKNIMYSYFY